MRRAFGWCAGMIAVLLVSGCSFNTAIKYQPIAGAPKPPSAAVAIKVVNDRAPALGGQGAQIGQVRNGYGMPFPVNADSPGRVERLVMEATTDALLQAGVATQAGSPRTLETKIKSFWVDGYVGYKASVEVEYALKDAGDVVLWTSSVNAGAGGVQWFGVTGFIEGLFQKALSDLANRSADEFKAPQFQKHVL